MPRNVTVADAFATVPAVEACFAATGPHDLILGLAAVAEPIRKAAPAETPIGEPIPGSMEHFMKMTHAPLVAACACPSEHAPVVEATFGDRGIVSCADCGSTWSVPFTVDAAGSVATGTPQTRLDTVGDPT